MKLSTNATFLENRFYHVFNRTNNREPLFLADNHFNFFLKRYQSYLGGFVDTYSYALLSNHFHLSIKVKSVEEILVYVLSLNNQNRTKPIRNFLSLDDKSASIHSLISSQFRRFFISYTQVFNKITSRKGNLLNRPFKRSLVDDDSKFAYLQYYIHHNARKHKLVANFTDYPYTSYQILLSDKPTFLNREFVYEWFGSREAFIKFHEASHYEEKFSDIDIED